MTHDFYVFFSVEFEKDIGFSNKLSWSEKNAKKPSKRHIFSVFLHFFHSSYVYSKNQYFFLNSTEKNTSKSCVIPNDKENNFYSNFKSFSFNGFLRK